LHFSITLNQGKNRTEKLFEVVKDH
jgi:hypothetical protein